MPHESVQQLAEHSGAPERRPSLAELISSSIKAASGALSNDETLEVIAHLLKLGDGVRSALVFSASLSERGVLQLRAVDPASARRIDARSLEDALVDMDFFKQREPYLDSRLMRDAVEKLSAAGWRDAGDERAIGLRFTQGANVYGGAFFHFDPEFADEVRALIPQVIDTANAFLAAERRTNVTARHGAAPRHAESIFVNLLAEMADAQWETTVDGRIRCVVLLKPSERMKPLQALEGRSLNALIGHTPAANAANDTFTQFGRHRVRLDPGEGPAFFVELCGVRAADEHWIGLARKIDSAAEQAANVRFARDLTSKLETARQQESDIRTEIEGLLDCLGILTQPAGERRVFDALLERVLLALEAEAGIILQKDWSGRTIACAATSSHFLECNWSESSSSLFAAEPARRILPNELTALHGSAWRSGLIVRLNDGPQPAVLLCLHHGPDYFGQRHLGLGVRLSLVTHQAFLIEEERQKVVQSSKLASMGEMAAGIAHEIMQPLSAMKLGVQNVSILLESGNASPDQLELLTGRLEKQIDRLSTIVRGMRNLSRRSDAGWSAFSVGEVVSETLSLLQYKLRQHNLQIKLDVSTDLEAFGNRLELGQIVLNLVNNAIDALGVRRGAEEHPACQIEIAAYHTDSGSIKLRLRDYGPGFSEAYLQRAFEPFITTKDVGKGTGLGLSLCRQMILNMSGDIRLGNWDGGAEVELTLPRRGPPEERADGSSS